MLSLQPIKRGDDFDIDYALPLGFANAIASIESQIREADNTLVEQLSVTRVANTSDDGVWNLTATSEQTTVWPLKNLYCDIKHIAVDGTVIRSKTFTIPVIKRITV